MAVPSTANRTDRLIPSVNSVGAKASVKIMCGMALANMSFDKKLSVDMAFEKMKVESPLVSVVNVS